MRRYLSFALCVLASFVEPSFAQSTSDCVTVGKQLRRNQTLLKQAQKKLTVLESAIKRSVDKLNRASKSLDAYLADVNARMDNAARNWAAVFTPLTGYTYNPELFTVEVSQFIIVPPNTSPLHTVDELLALTATASTVAVAHYWINLANGLGSVVDVCPPGTITTGNACVDEETGITLALTVASYFDAYYGPFSTPTDSTLRERAHTVAEMDSLAKQIYTMSEQRSDKLRRLVASSLASKTNELVGQRTRLLDAFILLSSENKRLKALSLTCNPR